MKITLLGIGKTVPDYLEIGCQDYHERLKKYTTFFQDYIIPPRQHRQLPPAILIKSEGELLIKRAGTDGYLVLLDEKGKQHSSKEFAAYLEKKMNSGLRHLVFCTGGAYGFSEQVQAEAKERISLSRMTFSHQLVRLVFLEQLYRAFTILRNEPYHNE